MHRGARDDPGHLPVHAVPGKHHGLHDRKQCLFVARAYYTLPIDVGIESVESDAKDDPQVLSEGQMRDILTRGGRILEQVLPQRGQLSDITLRSTMCR